ncbi:MAG: glycosyltransferase [Bacteroidetes bacterium]|nr:glycosyltransferase [Bacteroidota bacterium]
MENTKPTISVVIPVYRAENILHELYSQINESFKKINIAYELILVEDCGPDKSWEKIEEICRENHHVKAIKFSRNFGQHYAITAGLQKATGEWVIVMDCDLQDNPKEIYNLYLKATEGYDIVLAKRQNRQHSFIKTLISKLYYKTLSYFTNSNHDSSISNFGIYNKKVTDAFCKMGDSSRNFVTMTKWLGFKVAYVNVEHDKRFDGKSSYSVKKLMILGADTILYFSNKPLYITILVGFIISLLAISSGIFSLLKYLGYGIEISDYRLLSISLWFLSGVILFAQGIIGLYIGKIFDKIKDRPYFIVDKYIHINEDRSSRG